MPIANCILKNEQEESAEDVVDLWADFAAIDKSEITVNFLIATQQLGKKYDAMATIYLPSAWSREKAVSIQLGLARALSQSLKLPASSIHTILTIVESGHVVEDGEVVRW